MNKNNVYLLITADCFELPLMVADTFTELSQMSGYCYTTLRSAYERKSIIDGKYKIIKVDIREPEEKMTKKNFVKYCNENKLVETDFDSFKSYYDYCINS